MELSQKLLVGSGSRVIALVANVAIGLFLMPFIVHNLGDRIYGYWTLAATILGYYGLMDLGIVSAVQYYVAHAIGENNEGAANKAISSSFFACAILSILIILITFVVFLLTDVFIDDEVESILFKKVIIITGTSFAIGFPFRVFLGVISANLRFDIISFISIFSLFIRAIFVVIVLKLSFGIIGLALVNSLIELTNRIIFYPIAKRFHTGFKLSLRFASFKIFKDIFNYSVYNFIYKIALQLRFYLQVFIISSFIGITAVTHYTIASRLSQYFMSFMISSFGLLSPIFSQLKGSKDEKIIQESFVFATKLSVCIATFIASLLALYGSSFISMWMGAIYTDAYIPLVILLTGMLCEVSQFPSVSYLQGVAKHQYLAYISIVEGILNLVIGIILVRFYGLSGVAMGVSIPIVIIKVCIQPSYVCNKIGISLQYYYVRIIIIGFFFSSISILIPWIIIFKNIICDSYVKLAIYIFLQIIIALPIVYFMVMNKIEKKIIYNISLKFLKKSYNCIFFR